MVADWILKLKSRGQGSEHHRKMTKVKINNVEAELSDEQLQDLLMSVPKVSLEAALKKKTPITERVKTFDDALALVKVSDEVKNLLAYQGKDEQMLSSQAHAKLSIIAEALNEGWKPDWSNRSQYKYWPWLEFTPGVGFSFYGCDYDRSASCVGSRLCFKNSDLAKYAATQFQSIYNDFFN